MVIESRTANFIFYCYFLLCLTFKVKMDQGPAGCIDSEKSSSSQERRRNLRLSHIRISPGANAPVLSDGPKGKKTKQRSRGVR